MKFIYGISVIILLIFNDAIAQASTIMGRLDIGDKLPELVVPDMINYSSDKLDMKNLRGKYLILDFWTTRCSSCIAAFPKMQALQDKYQDQIKVILVTQQPKKMIAEFLKKRSQLTGITTHLPIAADNKDLQQYFDPPSYPHYVWIDSARVIRYITYSDEVNKENIEGFLTNQPLGLVKKEDTGFVNLDFKLPLFFKANGGNGDDMQDYAVLAKSPLNVATFYSTFNSGKRNSGIVAYNMCPKTFFQCLFNDYIEGYRLPDNRTDFQVSDSSHYVGDINGAIQRQNFYSCQHFSPFKTSAELKKMMQDDLTRYFGLEAHIEKRLVKCWVLSAEDTSVLVSKGGDMLNEISTSDFTMTLQNLPDSLIGKWFLYYIFEPSPYPFVNEIHMKSHIDIHLDNIDPDFAGTVIKALNEKYQVNITLEDRMVDMLVIRDKGNPGTVSTAFGK